MSITKALYNTGEAAAYLGYSVASIRKSRVEGSLSGQPAPEYFRSGNAVRYRKESLDKWIDQAEKSSEG